MAVDWIMARGELELCFLGLFYAIILLLEKQFFGKYLKKAPKVISWLITFGIINVGWLLFRINGISDLKIVW